MIWLGMNQLWKVPIATLRVFEAAARWQSFHAAATELNLTPSAVSHAIRRMEEALGVLMFERVGRGVALSAEGQTLLGYIERGFDEILRGLDAVSARTPRLLRLHCAPSFATQWLTPRLGRFLAQQSDVEVRLSASVDYGRFDTGEFDADIMYGHPRQEGLVVLPLKEETVTPLCAPHIAGEIESPTDLLRHQLIQSDNKQVRWSAWFAVNGMAVPSSIRGSRFDRSFLAIAAAADGLGIALESTLLAEREIARGRLVAPLAGRSQDIRYVGHHLVYPPPAERRAPLRAFALWLARELDITFTHFC
jgi:LysR family transcriptional regulator, glycine cleavage system transcriptional activator